MIISARMSHPGENKWEMGNYHKDILAKIPLVADNYFHQDGYVLAKINIFGEYVTQLILTTWNIVPSSLRSIEGK